MRFFRCFSSCASGLLDHPFLTKVQKTKNSFTNFQTLVSVLRRRIQPLKSHEKEHSPEHIREISELLCQVQINPKEWEQYTHFVRGRYTRTLVGFDEKFVALLLCWEKGQRSPIHDHAGSSCWVKVLSGSLDEILYHSDGNKLKEISTSRYEEGDVSYMNDQKGLHAIVNPSSTEVSVSLHIYAPPYRTCHIFQPINGEAKLVSMVSSNAPVFLQTSSSMFSVPSSTIAPLDHTLETVETDIIALPVESRLNSSSRLSLSDLVPALREVRHKLAGSDLDASALEEVESLLNRVNITKDEWDKYCSPSHFSEFNYTRNLVYINSTFSLIVVCWSSRQMTPLHSFSQGRHSWVKVVHGSLDLEVVEADGVKVSTAQYPLLTIEGFVICVTLTADRAQMHRRFESRLLMQIRHPDMHMRYRGCIVGRIDPKLVNRQSVFDAHPDFNHVFSVHLYSPPLKELVYKDPSGRVASQPVVCYHLEGYTAGIKDFTDDVVVPAAPSKSPKTEGLASNALPCVAAAAGADLSSPLLKGHIFTNLESFAKLCDIEFETALSQLAPRLKQDDRWRRGHRAALDSFGRRPGAGGPAIEEDIEEVLRVSGLTERLTSMMRTMSFNPLEWQQYAAWDKEHFTRVLLASSPYYSLVLSCWDRCHSKFEPLGQFSPVHDHAGSRNWIKLLQGTIDEIQYEMSEPRSDGVSPLVVSRSGTLTTDSVTFLGPATIHSCINDQDAKAFTLHLYSPPYTRTHYYEPTSGERRAIEIPLFDSDAIGLDPFKR